MTEANAGYGQSPIENMRLTTEELLSSAAKLEARAAQNVGKGVAEEADSLLTTVKGYQKDLEAAYKRDMAPIRAAESGVLETYKPLRQAMKSAEDACKRVLLQWKGILEKEELAMREKMRQAQAQAIVTGKPAEVMAPPPPPKLRSGSRTDWKWRLKDLTEVPMKFHAIDSAAVTRAVDSGAREIPGIDIYPETVILGK